MGFREELIQVAAVAVAIVQDLDDGTTSLEGSDIGVVLQQVEYERQRQEHKWGPQHHSDEEWLAILAEEVGEAATEVWGRGTHSTNMRQHLAHAEVAARAFLKERFGR